MQVNLELYRVFFMAATCGSLTKAAKELYISQPAVSQSIKQLESQLGGKLFVRTNKGMKLTYEGKVIFDYIKKAYGLIDMAERKFSELKELSIGEISIGASDTITKYYLLPYIKRFNAKYPDITIRMTNKTSQESIALLKDHEVDMAFINLPIPEETGGLSVTECMKVNDCFVCSPAYRKKISGPLSPKDIPTYPIIMLEKISTSRIAVDNAFAAYDVYLQPSLELGSVSTVIDFVKMSMGIGIVGREFVAGELAAGELVEVPTTFNLPSRTVAMAVNADVPLSFAAGQFLNMVVPGR